MICPDIPYLLSCWRVRLVVRLRRGAKAMATRLVGRLLDPCSHSVCNSELRADRRGRP